MPSTYVVLSRRDFPAVELSRVGQFDKVVVYQVDSDPNQVRTVRLPVTSWTQQAEDTAIKANEAAHASAPNGARSL